MQFFDGVVQILMSLLHLIQFRLLIGREQRADLRHGIIQNAFRLGHGILMDRLELRFRLIDDRLDLRFLVRGQVQCFGHVIERASAVAMPTTGASRTAVPTRFRLSPCKTTRADRGDCYYCQ